MAAASPIIKLSLPVDPRSIALIEEMAAVGLAAADIMRCLGWGPGDLHMHQHALPTLDAAIQRGRARAKHAIMAGVFAKAIAGDLKAARLYLAVHAGWNLRGSLPRDLFQLDAQTFERESKGHGAAAVGLDPKTLAEWERVLRAEEAEVGA